MARQDVSLSVQPQAYADAKLGPLFQAIAFKAENVSTHSQFAELGREVLLAWNKDTAVAEVQAMATGSGTVTNGFVIVTLVVQGITYISPHISFNALPSAVQTGLLTAIDSNGTQLQTRHPGGIICSGTTLPSGSVTITFSAGLGGQLIALATADSAGLVGGTFAITETTPGSGQHTVTVSSVNDPYNRTQDITAVVGAGTICVFPYFKNAGWRQVDGKIYVAGNHAMIWFGVIQTPALSSP